MSQKPYSRFNPKDDFSQLDYIIIGSGIGGLTTATWLAKAGKKVVVFERHYVPGGFTHSFKRKHGFQWDVGVHYVGNMAHDNGLRDLFDFLTSNKVDWESMGETYDVVQIAGDTYEFKAGQEAFQKQMITYFPKEEKAINEYLKLIDKSNKAARFFFAEKAFPSFLSTLSKKWINQHFAPYSQKTTLQILSELTSNQRLIAVLCAQCGNYGLSPKYSSFAAHAMVIAHFMEGGYFPKGGAEQLCFQTIETLNTLGGKVYINAEVQEIVTENKKVRGIRVNEQFIACKNVISNVGVYNTYHQLLSKEAQIHSQFNFQKIKPSTGHICLYVGLDASDEDLQLPKHNVWYYANDQYDMIHDVPNVEDAPKKFAYISFPSAKDPEWQQKNPGTSTLQAITIGRYEWFSKFEKQPWMKRDKDYMAIKAAFETSMLQGLYKLFPQIEGHVKITEVSSPLSTKHFANYQHGEIYGLAHTPERFTLPFLRPETKIKGLRLVGQDITIVGVAGAMLSGMLCAITILKFNVWKVFRAIAKNKNRT